MSFFGFQRVAEGYARYRHAPAEELPFDDRTFKVITVCGAINWIDRSRFFPEAKRVLKENGYIGHWLLFFLMRKKEFFNVVDTSGICSRAN